MTNMGLISESTGKIYNKVENMCTYWSDDTRASPNLNKMERSDIEGATRTQLVTSINVFSSWMLIQSKIFLDGIKIYTWFQKSCKIILEAALRDEVLCVLFLDLHKAYGALDRSRCLEILDGYGVGTQARGLLKTYWRRLTMVARAGRYYGTGFRGREGWWRAIRCPSS